MVAAVESGAIERFACFADVVRFPTSDPPHENDNRGTATTFTPETTRLSVEALKETVSFGVNSLLKDIQNDVWSYAIATPSPQR